MKINSVVKLCALTAAICAANASYAAGPQTATVTIHATVAPTCSISATSLEFNNYDPTSTTDKTGTGTVTLTCVKGKRFRLDDFCSTGKRWQILFYQKEQQYK